MRRADSTPLIQLAPMEGVLDWVLREMLSAVGGLDRMVTEFVRVTDKIVPDHVFYKYCPELLNGGRTAAGVPVFVQLLGGQPEPMAVNAARVAELGAPGVDLNFGCPAKTVNRHDGGAALLKHPERLFFVCRAVRKAVPAHIPVTAKVRLGFEHKDYHREIAAAVDEAGASHIVVHARTKMEMYTPPAHWSFIKSMSEGRTLPFLANGEIWSVQDYWRCREASGVDRVALGRGLVSRPTLALEIRKSIAQAASCATLSGQSRESGQTLSGQSSPFDNSSATHEDLSGASFSPIDFLDEFFNRSVAVRGPHYGVARLKQMLRYWSRDSEVYTRWFHQVKVAQNVASAQEFLQMIRKEDELCPKLSCTARKVVPIASAPSSY